MDSSASSLGMTNLIAISDLTHDLPRQTQTPPSRATKKQARLYASRLRGHRFHAVRGLRPRLDLGRDYPGILRARLAAAPRSEAVRHRLLVQDSDVLPRQLARLQQRAWAYALGADRREPS